MNRIYGFYSECLSESQEVLLIVTKNASDLMWADPSRKSCTNSTDDFQANSDRGTSYLFSDEAVKAFNEKLDLDLVVRAHEMTCTSHNEEFFLFIQQLEVSFVTLKPRIDEEKLQNMSMEEKAELQQKLDRNMAKSPKPGGT
uniref:protein-serine/threonine phosphatase n=1 Tax=Ditylenchus dipsaci TaxID=166011 RepID=A0A915D8A5_9BILA